MFDGYKVVKILTTIGDTPPMPSMFLFKESSRTADCMIVDFLIKRYGQPFITTGNALEGKVLHFNMNLKVEIISKTRVSPEEASVISRFMICHSS